MQAGRAANDKGVECISEHLQLADELVQRKPVTISKAKTFFLSFISITIFLTIVLTLLLESKQLVGGL